MQIQRVAELLKVPFHDTLSEDELEEEFVRCVARMPRWFQLKYIEAQYKLITDLRRFKLGTAGRRSGKTEAFKRHVIREACLFRGTPPAWFVCGAPTRDQAKRIFWQDLKDLIPPQFSMKRPSESDLTLYFPHAEITILGMDEPQRVEGRILDGIGLDEFGNIKPEAWTENIRPALSSKGREGWAWIFGVPEGRNHYYRMVLDSMKPENVEDWGHYTWRSSDLLDPKEIEQARRTLDELTFRQEYEGEFVNFSGLVYYPFDRQLHVEDWVQYDPTLPVYFCWDFNVDPGVCAVLQELPYRGTNPKAAPKVTAVVDEVWIEGGSNTVMVCRELLKRYSGHRGLVFCFGDASGGARGTAKVDGSDWQLIKKHLKPVFGDRLKFRIPTKNPRERVRVNSVNSRLRAADGTVALFFGPKAPMSALDFECVVCRPGTDGEIHKKADPLRSHISDAIGYYIVRKFPIVKSEISETVISL